MKRVFISVGMNGRSYVEIMRDIMGAENAILELAHSYGIDISEIEVIDNHDCPYPEVNNPGRLWYLGEAIKKLGTCDTCYFCKGWRDHKGCRVEMEICKIYGIDIIEEE